MQPLETEQQLQEAVKAGDRQAMRRLYERYKGYAMSIGLRYIPNGNDVEDVVHDSFVTVLTSIQRFRYQGEGSLKSWMGRIVANKAIDFVRQHERISFTSGIPDTPDEEPEPEGIPPEVLTKMIAQLPSGYRLVLNLYVFEHYSHKEIARRLGIGENSSSSQLARAKNILIRKMKDYTKHHRT